MDRAVSEVMHHGVLTCTEQTSVQDVAQMMTEHDVSALVVVNARGGMVGLISRTDLVNARLYEQYWKNWQELKAWNLMTPDVVSVQATDTIGEASKLMMEKKIHRVVVIEESDDEKKPIGVLSITDLVREISSV
jgi:signal-transduction protein with cAMP-binding, CBS, and nucleotidyltransferase domain